MQALLSMMCIGFALFFDCGDAVKFFLNPRIGELSMPDLWSRAERWQKHRKFKFQDLTPGNYTKPHPNPSPKGRMELQMLPISLHYKCGRMWQTKGVRQVNLATIQSSIHRFKA
jgi:hypothetical protein